MSGVDIYSNRFTFACYIYIYLGIAVFFLGWVRAIFAIPALLLLGFCLWQHWGTLREREESRRERPVIRIFLCLVAGQGAFFVQAGDWEKHNFVLNDLVMSRWPVCYHNDDSDAMLTYYVAQYLVPALFGKVFSSFRAAEVALLVCNVVGILGVLLLVFRVVRADTGKKRVWDVPVFGKGAVWSDGDRERGYLRGA